MNNNYNSLSTRFMTCIKTFVRATGENTRVSQSKGGFYSWMTVLLVLLSLTVSQRSWSQSITNYVFASNTNGSLEDLSSGSTSYLTGNLDTAAGTVQPLGFNFTFMGTSYSHFSANSNGQMALHTSSGATAIGTSVTTAAGTAILAAFTGDNEVNNGLRFKVIGTAPNRTFVLEWNQFYVGWANLTNAGNMQVWLDETTGKITYIYGEIFNANTSSITRSISIASSNTATTVGSVTIGASPTFTASASLVSNTIAAGTNPVGSPLVANIGSNAQGSRRFFTFTPVAVTTPSNPTSLTFTNISGSTITPNWIDNSTDETYFTVTRATDAAFTQNVVVSTLSSTTAAATGGAYSLPQTGLGLGITYYFKIQANTEGGTPGSGLTGSSVTVAGNFTVNSIGGLWNNAATWVGGVVPGPNNNITIPAGAIVTIDTAVSPSNLTIDGTLQWNGTSNAMTLAGNLVINSGGIFRAYTTGGAGQTINIAGNFQNDGFANLALASLNFNGSGSTLSGTGTFQGFGSKGIIRSLTFANTGSNSISTSSNLIVTAGFTHTAGSLNTNGKLTLDNTAQIYGTSFNTTVTSVAVTNMGSLYTVAPVVFGAAFSQWTNITGAVGTRYVSGNNVYICTTAANIGPAAPTHTSGVAQNLLWLGTTGTLGNPYPFNVASTVGTQYFYGDNLYVATVANTIAANTAANAPVHTSGIVGGYLYVGTVAKATVNYDATSQTVRSLNLTSAGSGYSSAPSVAFAVGVAGGTGSGAAASTTFFQQIIGPSSFLTQKSGGATISGGLTINSDADAGALAPTNEQASSGVAAISTSNGGVNYTVAPQIGFAGPTALNLIVNPGSGYTAAPTITVSGGTLIAGTAYTSGSFTIAVNAGKVQAVYLTSTSAVYSVPPTLTMSAPGAGTTATLEFPAGCWPSATPVLGSNGQIVNFTVTNSGYGYVTAPATVLGATSGTSAGGTFTTAATTPTTRIALYNLTINNFIPSAAPAVHGDDVAIPANRKINTLNLGSLSAGLNLSSNLVLFGSSPLSLNASTNAPGSVINLGGNNLLFTWNGYGGATATFGATSNAYIKNGSMTLIGRGGSSTFNYPFSGTFSWFAGNGSNDLGSSVTRVTVSDTAAPSNAAMGTSFVKGARAFRVQYANIGAPGFTSLPVTGTNPTVTMNFNNDDALTAFTQDLLLISDSPSLTGPWSFKSVASGSGAITSTTTGTRTTATAAPGPIAPTGNNYYAWSVSAPTITDFSPLTVCATTGTFTITGTNLSGITNLQIGGTPVTSFTIVSPTQITGVAASGTSGFVSFVKGTDTITGTQSITVTASPSAPTATPATANVILGGSPNVTASGSGGTFNWFTAATGGSPVLTGPTYNLPVCSSTTLYVSENNGSCDGPRTAVPITVTPTVIAASPSGFCGSGGTSVLTVTPSNPAITYTWTNSGGTLNTNVGESVSATITASSEFTVTATNGACSTSTSTSIGVYALPSATVTTTASGVCPGTSATINSGLAAGNFSVTCITSPTALATPPVGATVLCSGGSVVAPLSGGGLDDGYWNTRPIGFSFNFFGASYSTINIGTNGTLVFGATGTTTFSFPGGFPNTANPANTIAVCAHDFQMASGTTGQFDFGTGAVTYWTEGVAPNRRFIVQYANATTYYSTNATDGITSAEAVLYETTGIIDIRVIQSTNPAATTGTFINDARNKYIGLQNGDKTIGATAPNCTTSASNYWNGQSAEILTPQAWRFDPPAHYSVTWTAHDLVTDVTTTPVNNVTDAFSLAVSPINTTQYTISYTNQTTGCTNALNSAQVTMNIISATAPSTTAVASASTICLNGSSNLTLTGNVNNIGNTDGLTYQWQVDTGSGFVDYTGTGATTAAITVAPTVVSTYRCMVTACSGTAVPSTPVSIGFTNVIDSTTPATRCGAGQVSLSATTSASGASIKWYAAATGGTALFTGSPYTPTISGTTTYYVAAETTGPDCSSPRVQVVATVTSPPAFALNAASTTICTGTTSATFTDAAAGATYDTFSITPTTGVAASNLSGVFSASFNPTVTTTYTINASQSGGSLCTTSTTFTVIVNNTVVTASASPTTVCLGGSSTITALTNIISAGTVTMGTDTTLTSDTTQPTAFCNRWPSARLQMVYTAAELQAAGLSAGNITSMAFNIATLGNAATNDNMVIQMGSTSLSTLSDFVDTSGFTTVYPSQTYTHTASGLQTIPFSTPYNWDGTSNIIFDMVQSGANLTNNSQTYYTATPGNTVAYTTTSSTNSASLSTNRLNVVFAGQANTPGVGTLNYTWNDPSNTTGNVLTISPSATTTYTVTGTNPSTGCSGTATATVTVLNGSAEITTAPAAQVKCLAGTASFTVAATGLNLTYQWRKGTTNLTDGTGISGATTATLTLTGLTAGDAGNYNVVVSSDCGAPATSADAALTVISPLAGINASATTVCSGTPVTLTENGGTATSWVWSGGSTTNPYVVTPTFTQTYTVTATSEVAGCTATANVTINVNQTPGTISVSAEGLSLPYAICDGSPVKMNATDGGYTGPATTVENFDAVSSLFTAATVSGDGTTVTTATLDTAIKTQGTGSVLFTSSTDPDSSISSEATYSLNTNIDLSASQVATLTFSHIASMEGAAANSYDYGYVQYSTNGGSTWTTFNSSAYTGAADTSLFNAGAVRFSTRSYADWKTGLYDTVNSATVAPTNALWKNESFTIPTAALTSQFRIRFRYTLDTSEYYQGWWIDNVVLNYSVTVNPQYSWTATPATTLYTDAAQTTVYNPLTDFAPAVYATPSANTVFAATVTNGSCSNSSNTTVSIKALPSFTVSDKTLCSDAGGVIVSPVGGDGANTYVWSPTASLSGGNIGVDGTSTNIDVITANPSSTTSYSVTANNNTTGCVSTPQAFTVTVNPQAVSAASTPPTRIKSATTSTTFTVSSLNAVAYQWQVREGSGSFIDIDGGYTPVDGESYSGATTATLTIDNISELMTGFSYRCKVKGAGNCAFVIPSNAEESVLTVQTIGFVANFPADFTLCESGDATFSIQTTGGTPENYIWQVSTNNGPFTNITDGFDAASGFEYSGATTANLDITGITYSATNSYRYQVAIDDESVTSDFASLKVNKTIVGTQAPQNNSLCSLAASSVMSAKATGTISGVTWEYGTSAAGPWSPVANGTPSNITYSSSLPAAATTDGERTATLLISSNATTPVVGGPYFYRATFLRANGECTDFTTTSGQLDITTPVLSSQPASTSVIVTNSATFTVGISGAATYQWQYSTSASSGFQDIPTGSQTGASYSGTTSATLTVTTSGTTPFAANNYYRARVTSGGCIVYSNAAQLTVTDYCAPTYVSGSVSGNSITRVVLGTLTNNSGASTSPFYTFYSNVTVPDLIKLSTNSVAVTVGANANQYTGVWIDFNQNGTFEASEGVVSTTNTASGGTSTLSVLIPSTATVGQTRMRVRGGDDVAMLTSQACGATNSVVGETEDYLVNVIATPAPAVTSVPASACALSTIAIGGTNFYNVTAVTVNGTPVSSFTATSATAITATLAAGTTSGVVSVTAAGGTGSSTSVTVNPLPAIPVITGGGSICGATTTSINASNGGEGTMYYQGTTNNGTSTATTGAQTITIAGTYYFRAVSAEGCWGPQASTTVQFLTAPVAPTTTSYTICPGGAIPVGQGLTSTSVGSNVTGTQTIPFNITAQPAEVNAAPGVVLASATMPALPAGATITSLVLRVNGITPQPTNSWASDVKLGLSGALINDAASGDGAVNNSTSVGVLFNYIRTFSTGITGTPLTGGTVNILYWDSTNDNAGVEAIFTTGSVATLTVNYSYPNPNPVSWYTAATGGAAIGTGTPFNPIGVAGSGLADSNTPGTYPFYAEVNNGNCTSTRTVANIIVQDSGPFTASSIAATETSGTAANDGAICTGASVTLTGSSTGGGGGLSYEWKVGGTTVSTASSFTITPALTATTTYDLTISDACGQTITASRTITVNSLPTVSISSLTPAQARICGTGSVSMTATGASTYVWTPTTGLTPTSGSPVSASPSATTSYTVVGTDVNGCVSAASAPQVITVGPAVAITVAATPDAICSGGTAVLSANNATPVSYCTPAYTQTDGTDYIATVALKDATGATTLYTRTSGLAAIPAYDDQTALTTTTLTAGTSYQISVTIGNSGDRIAAFMDFNRDGDFADSGETIRTSTSVASGGTTTATFAVPAGALNGNTRLRVVNRFNAVATSCNNTGYGETEDYTVGITGGVSSLNYAWTGSNGFTSSLQNPTTPALTTNASYSVTATDPVSGCSATGSTSVAVTNCGVTQLSNCGSTPALPSVNTRIFAANTVSGASAYRFRVAVSTAPTSYFYAVTAYPSFRLTDVVGLTPTYGTTYNVDIQTEYTVGASTVVGAYGPMCTVTTQLPTNITVPTNQCGQTLAAVNSKIYVNGVAGATMYTYRIAKQSAPTQYGYIETPYSNFRLTAPLTSGSVVIEHGTIYLVSVSVTTASGSSNFNGECIITTPAGPTTTLQASQCGDDETPYVIPTKSTKVYAADFVSGATYTFKLEQYSGATLVDTNYATSPINYFDCNMFTGDNSLLPNTNYHVYVAVNYYGQGDYDHDCVIKTPAALKQVDMITDFKAVAYPNPFANNFMIDVKSSSESSVNLKVYDMIGRLIEQRDVRMSDLETTTIGDRYPSGVYNVVVTQESTVQTVRVVKR
ncbi:MAG: GEVED domain-containing protein [Flavobacterium sp. JAD_PAG50586_2]|nr:MAG: GEVED domain-containing protein [Flavobacterium sp. JAD_PAG50586_2]